MILFVPYKTFSAAKLSFNDVINKTKQLTMLLIQSSVRFVLKSQKEKQPRVKQLKLNLFRFSWVQFILIHIRQDRLWNIKFLQGMSISLIKFLQGMSISVGTSFLM